MVVVVPRADLARDLASPFCGGLPLFEPYPFPDLFEDPFRLGLEPGVKGLWLDIGEGAASGGIATTGQKPLLLLISANLLLASR